MRDIYKPRDITNHITEARSIQAQAPRASTKASASELKPKRLTHDASVGTFCSWKKCFRAYYDSAQMGSLPCLQQQAYLCNCVDTVLRARIDREATNTTPVYSPIVGLYTCIAILDNVFLESYPIYVRRKLFFDARQKDGQSALEFSCLLYTSPSPRDRQKSRMPSSA